MEDLRVIFFNFYHILNEYRPHQARESLIATMQAQLDSKREEKTNVNIVVDKARRILEGLNSMDLAAQAAAAASLSTMEIDVNAGASGANAAKGLGNDVNVGEFARWSATDNDFA
jgi:mediator of RNA polymerase II transcription subunit 7